MRATSCMKVRKGGQGRVLVDVERVCRLFRRRSPATQAAAPRRRLCRAIEQTEHQGRGFPTQESDAARAHYTTEDYFHTSSSSSSSSSASWCCSSSAAPPAPSLFCAVSPAAAAADADAPGSAESPAFPRCAASAPAWLSLADALAASAAAMTACLAASTLCRARFLRQQEGRAGRQHCMRCREQHCVRRTNARAVSSA